MRISRLRCRLYAGLRAGWGRTLDGQVPTHIANRTDITAISSRTRVNMALTRNGTILMWGSVVGALDGMFIDFRRMMPPEAEPAKAIAAGSTHFLAVGVDGKVCVTEGGGGGGQYGLTKST
jgi:alpha-tubulin suppressor-like RCC1 family protein